MNTFLAPSFDERADRLALGLEPIDALRGTRVAASLRAEVESLRGLRLIARHPSCVHALLEQPGLSGPIAVRFSDDSRRYVARRFSVAFSAGMATVVRPRFFPGAAYDVSERCTALRGRVLRGIPKAPMRWARVEARLSVATPLAGRLVGLAHGDDRGEFLLLIGVDAATAGPVVNPLPIEVTVFGPLPNPPLPSSPDLPSRDALWDVPIEAVPNPDPDLTASGVALPSNYGATPSSTAIISLQLGQQNSIGDITFQ